MLRATPDQLRRDWSYSPSAPSLLTRIRRWRLQGHCIAFPATATIRAPFPALRWNCLFLFAPDASLDHDQRRILARVRALKGRLLLVVATPCRDHLPSGMDIADALIWKDLPGFDFSAYSVALTALARHAPGTTAYVQNDSVLGPFGDLDALVARAHWDLTGFLASSAIENHISSFAFVLKGVTSNRLKALRPAITDHFGRPNFGDVVMLQETLLARTAARNMTVGSFWYLASRPTEPSIPAHIFRRFGLMRSPDIDMRDDATLSFPLDLLDRGFPFLKRSLFTKFAHVADREALAVALQMRGWNEPLIPKHA